MRDQYAGDISDFLKISFLRALAGSDRKLGVAWYYVPGHDGKRDGSHREWRFEDAWRGLDPQLHMGLSGMAERSIAGLEAAKIWPVGTRFHSEAMPHHSLRNIWGSRKRDSLADADLLFLDPDNGVGKQTRKHATYAELGLLRKAGRTLTFITFPGRNLPHDELLGRLHGRVQEEAGATSIGTIKTTVSVPCTGGTRGFVPRQRWFTLVDPDAELIHRAQCFVRSLAYIPRVTASWHPDLKGC